MNYPTVRTYDELVTKFWHFTNKRSTLECWPFLHCPDAKGYGRLTSNGGQTVKAHVFSWEIANSKKVQSGEFVCHSCDNPCCVNPHHLFLGNSLLNNRDRAKKGRNADINGEKHPMVKLTEEQVRQIRRLYSGRYGDLKRLGKQFGVTFQNIFRIVNNLTWSKMK